VTLFKQGSRTAEVVDESIDEEKAAHAEAAGRVSTDVSPVALEKPSATDIFTWRHLEYTVPISGGEQRRLLDDVSGYVAPGKLTALMGESGAGKVTCLYVCAVPGILYIFLDYSPECLGSAYRRWRCGWRSFRQWSAPPCGLSGTDVRSTFESSINTVYSKIHHLIVVIVSRWTLISPNLLSERRCCFLHAFVSPKQFLRAK